LTLLDENETRTKYGSAEADYEEWEKKLLARFVYSALQIYSSKKVDEHSKPK
jgi:hypothetical protein